MKTYQKSQVGLKGRRQGLKDGSGPVTRSFFLTGEKKLPPDYTTPRTVFNWETGRVAVPYAQFKLGTSTSTPGLLESGEALAAAAVLGGA